jgi:hypothetical protein
MTRRWNQFSLRAVLILVAVCALLAGIWAAYFEPYRREQQVLAEMQGKQVTVATEAIGPGWLKWLAQGRYAQRVVRVDLGQDVTDSDLARLNSFGYLQTVMIASGPGVTDEGLGHLAKISGLRELMLAEVSVSNEGLRHLQGTQSLWKLWISSDQITDDGLITIGKLTELRELAVQANVTDKGMQYLGSLTKLETLRCLSLDQNSDRIRSTLSSPTDFDFVKVPLLDACEYFADHHGAPIRVDYKALEASGVDPHDLTVTAVGQRESFGDCFRALLAPHGLEYRVESSGLVVTTVDVAGRDRRGILGLRRTLPSLKQVEVWW